MYYTHFASLCLLLGAPVSLSAFLLSSRTCYGNIDNLHPTGRGNGGVTVSNREAKTDKPTLDKFRKCYDKVADKNCIQASVIAAIASRESRGGSLLVRTGGYGDHNHAWGIMQCDLRYSGLPCKSCAWNSCCHIEMMVSKLLIPYIKQVAKKYPTWSKEQKLQGGVAAYNFGVSNVVSWSHLDRGSTNGDYSNDVIARAKYLRQHGWN